MNKQKIKIFSVLFVVLAGFIMMMNSTYIVPETQQAIVTQFGKPAGSPVTEPGVHFKIPMIQQIHYFDKRYLEWDGSPNQVPTKDKKFIFVDTYARWQIIDPLQFFKRLRDEQGAFSRLDDILDGETRNSVANNDLVELVRDSNRIPEENTEFAGAEDDYLEKIVVGRKKIEKRILERANERVKDLGIAILDFRFKRMIYVEDVQKKVFERMISERNRIADKFRSEGQGEASRINGERERELKKIQSEAFRKAQEIMGKADAEAASIYTAAYNKNQQSKDLYNFVKTMEAYEKTFDEKTSVIISTNSPFYQYLNKLD